MKATQSAVSAAASASSAVDATNNGTTAANAVVGNMYTKSEADAKIVALSPPATQAHVNSLGVNAQTLDGVGSTGFLRHTGMEPNKDTYINLRVIRNSGSSAGSDGMYIGYDNAGVSETRIYGGGTGDQCIRVFNPGRLEVPQSIKLGDDTRTAATAGAGTLRFNTGKLQASDGGTWEDVNYNNLSDNPCSVLGFPITGEVCGTVINTAGSVGGCSEGDYTWAQFKGYCENIGARLCTRDEIKAGEVAGTGCSHDSRGVWSSTPGDTAGTYWVVNGSWESSQREQELNATSSTGLTGFAINQFGLRCCGDNY